MIRSKNFQPHFKSFLIFVFASVMIFQETFAQISTVPDSCAVVCGGEEYEAGFLRKIFLGKLYRTSWTEPVSIPFLHLDTIFGGLTPLEKGGGRQTTSLTFKGGDGFIYVFRSVDKHAVDIDEPIVKKTVLRKLPGQLTATEHPYGAMVVKELLNHTTILHVHPVLYVLPDNEKLGAFKNYAGLFGMLEEKPEHGENGNPTLFGADEIINSETLFKKLKDSTNHVDAMAYGRARLFDIWIGDWGRHPGNWKWAGFKNGKEITYYPIPRDRDHSFSHWNGILPFLLSRSWTLRNAQNFSYHLHNLSKLGYAARELDQLILPGLKKEDWLKLAEELQKEMTDTVIDGAIHQLPENIIPISGIEIGAKLKSRREELSEGALKFYTFLSKKTKH